MDPELYLNNDQMYNSSKLIGNMWNNSTAVNDSDVNVNPMKTAFNVTIISLQLCIMISMGCIVTVSDILGHLKMPTGIFIAMVSQFFIMPVSSFGIINLLQLPSSTALSAMVLSCCPGGSASNLFSYICGGDVPLSVVLTTISTVMALGMMPLNIWIYSQRWYRMGEQISLPFASLAITLAWILVPGLVGMLLRSRLPNVARIINKIGSFMGMVLIWVLFILQYLVYTSSFNQSWRIWIAAVAIPTTGFLLGYAASHMMRQSHRLCRTIAIETGMQSVSLALTIVITSFPAEIHDQLTPILMIYGIYLNIAGFFLALAVWLQEKFHSGGTNFKEKSIDNGAATDQIVNTVTK